MVTTGALTSRSAGSSWNSRRFASSSSVDSISTLRSNSSAKMSMVSSGRDWVIVTISPSPIMVLMISLEPSSSASAIFFTVAPLTSLTGSSTQELVSQEWQRPPGARKLPSWLPFYRPCHPYGRPESQYPPSSGRTCPCPHEDDWRHLNPYHAPRENPCYHRTSSETLESPRPHSHFRSWRLSAESAEQVAWRS